MDSIINSGNKLSTAGLFFEDLPAIPQLEITQARNKYTQEKAIPDWFNQTLLAKPICGSQAQGIIQNLNIKNISNIPSDYLVQLQIEAVECLRIIICQQQILAIYKKSKNSEDIFKTIDTTNKLPLESVPEKIREASIKYSQAIQLQYSGIDILKDTEQKYWFLETNSCPGIPDYELAKKIVNLTLPI